MIMEFILDEFGYFTERECEEIRKTCEGTYMNIRVSWSKGNSKLIISTDYFDNNTSYEDARNATVGMFVSHAFAMLAKISRENA